MKFFFWFWRRAAFDMIKKYYFIVGFSQLASSYSYYANIP